VRKFIVVLLLVLMLVPSGVALAAPLECEYAMETMKWTDWLWCGVVLVIRAFLQEGPTDAGMPPVG